MHGTWWDVLPDATDVAVSAAATQNHECTVSWVRGVRRISVSAMERRVDRIVVLGSFPPSIFETPKKSLVVRTADVRCFFHDPSRRPAPKTSDNLTGGSPCHPTLLLSTTARCVRGQAATCSPPSLASHSAVLTSEANRRGPAPALGPVKFWKSQSYGYPSVVEHSELHLGLGVSTWRSSRHPQSE